MPYDLFISYSRRDNTEGRITQLVERIKADFAPFAKRELVPFFDQQEIEGMQDWRQRILQGLRESRLLLACLSPAYLKSEYCEWEFVEYLKYEIGHLHGFNGVAPIYFVEVPGWNDKDFEQQSAAWVAELRKRQNFDLRPWHDQGEAALRETAVQERMGKLNRQIVQTITRGERAEKSLGNVDAHNPHFIGRTANLRMLRENFVTPGHIGVVTAVNGVGGLGKTALAIEYAHAFADEYGGGRWQVRCAGKDDLRLALAELATPIGFEFTDDEKKNADLQFERTRRELKKLADAAPFGVPPSGGSRFGVPPSGGPAGEPISSPNQQPEPPEGGTPNRTPNRVLLILDNVDRPGLLDPAQVARLNGGDWLHVLATTRLGENELHGAHRDRSFLAIDELPPDDALALIESYQPGGRFRSEACPELVEGAERDAAREIVRLLGSFTLAVESAAVYLGQFANDVTCAAFLARLKKEGLEGLDTAASQSSEGVLHGEKRLSATLQPTLERLGAAEKLTLEFAALLPPDQVPLPWLRALVAKTFPEMERDAEPGYPDPWKNVVRRLLSLRLIQATDEMDADGQPRIVRVHRLVQELVAKHISNKLELEAKLYGYLSTILIEMTGQSLAILSTREQSASELLVRQLGGYSLAMEMAAAFIRRQRIGFQDYSNQLEKAQQRLNAATLGERKAEQFFEVAVANSERQHGPAHLDTATAIQDLAEHYRQCGKFREAEPLYRRALQIYEQALGPDHPNMAFHLSRFASVLIASGHFSEAELALRRSLHIIEVAVGPQHALVSDALEKLGEVLLATNRHDEAEVLLRRSLLISESILGPRQSKTLRCVESLVKVLEALGKDSEAANLRRRYLA